MSVVGQIVGLFAAALIYVLGVALAARGRQSWYSHLPELSRSKLGESYDRPVAQTVRLVIEEARSRSALAEWIWVVVVFAVLFVVPVSFGFEVLFVAGVATTFAIFQIQSTETEGTRVVADRAGTQPLPREWQAGVLLAYLGFWGMACFLGGLLVAAIK